MDLSGPYLRHHLRSVVANNLAAFSEEGKLPMATYTLACFIIPHFLGPEWCQRHLCRTAETCDYFKASTTDHAQLLRYLSRVTELAELIYNLQGVAGFDQRITSIKADEKTGIESGIAELFGGKFFKIAGAQFQYAIPSTEPGVTNPDIEYVAGVNHVESCDVKCNLGMTELNERPIINALEKGRKQLPKGKAGLILLRVPEEWFVEDEVAVATIEAAITSFFRRARTTRISSVFIFLNRTKVLFSQKKMAQILQIKQFRNDHCELGPGICLPDLTNGAPNWHALQGIVATELGLQLP